MSATDSYLAYLNSMESKAVIGLAAATAFLLHNFMGVPVGLPQPDDEVSKVVYNSCMTDLACSHVSEITSPTVRPVVFVPKTTLGARLFALRQKAIDRGTPFLTERQIIEEVMRRRGDLSDA
ncbi:MAG: hypothetical protein ACRERV_01675 [Methylococcales bacterium]